MSPAQKNISNAPQKKPGLFKRLIERLDRGLKAKADKKAASGCCSGSGDKGGKCC
ncbi:hypothetical protein H5P28_07680 [Ruficoccus amylovorans]|uniref:Uncharacterized protein n=1 Tax=Ruficoccus amylovorans TaxID=1804625 RepID=A0A842HFT3_9BACT|nr:hypothetical protein [Ruficoccus amylovorans]MBC2594141.1 hypothetical protein [Ruficoccus amylovorans]